MANSSSAESEAISTKIADLRQQIRSFAQQRAEGLIDADLQRDLVKDLQNQIKDLEQQQANLSAPESNHADADVVDELIEQEEADAPVEEDTNEHPEVVATEVIDDTEHAVAEAVDETLIEEADDTDDETKHAETDMVEEMLEEDASDDPIKEDTNEHPDVVATEVVEDTEHAEAETVDETLTEEADDTDDKTKHAETDMVEEMLEEDASGETVEEDTHEHPEVVVDETSDEPEHADKKAATEVIEEETNALHKDEEKETVPLGNFADDVVVSSAMVKEPDYLNSIHDPNVVDIRDITKTYKMGEFDLQVLKGITMQVRQGEFVSIMGPSGSGKSTLMNILGALDQPTSGEYFLDNVDVSKLDEKELAEIRNSKIGFVFQSFNLLKRTTAQRQVELPLIYGSHKDRARKAREALEAVGLGQRLDHTPAELSGGQQQRVAIARALVTEPSLILADEPTGNLDSRSGTEVMQLFQTLNRKNNITTIFVTHDPWIARHTDRVIMLRDGKIIADQRVKNPLVAGEAERPSEAEELQAIFESTYYGGDEEEYT